MDPLAIIDPVSAQDLCASAFSLAPPVVLTVATSMVAACSAAAAFLPPAQYTSGWYFQVRRVIDWVAFNVKNAANKH